MWTDVNMPCPDCKFFLALFLFRSVPPVPVCMWPNPNPTPILEGLPRWCIPVLHRQGLPVSTQHSSQGRVLSQHVASSRTKFYTSLKLFQTRYNLSAICLTTIWLNGKQIKIFAEVSCFKILRRPQQKSVKSELSFRKCAIRLPYINFFTIYSNNVSLVDILKFHKLWTSNI